MSANQLKKVNSFVKTWFVQIHRQSGIYEMLPLLHHAHLFRGLAREKRFRRRHHRNIRRIPSPIPTNVG